MVIHLAQQTETCSGKVNHTTTRDANHKYDAGIEKFLSVVKITLEDQPPLITDEKLCIALSPR